MTEQFKGLDQIVDDGTSVPEYESSYYGQGVRWANCIFLAPIEWSLIEQTLSLADLAEYAQKGFKHVVFENGESFEYLPIMLNGLSLRALRGVRPTHE